MAGTTSRASGSTPDPKTTTPVVTGDTDPVLTSGQSVEETTENPSGLAGVHGFDEIAPDSKEGKKDARERARVLAPHLSDEFISAFKLSDETVRDIADGRTPPPPAIGPNYTGDLYLTPGGWQHTGPGVAPGESSAIAR